MSEVHIEISLAAQQLYLYQTSDEGNILLSRLPISTARNGAGELEGSFCTPRGAHRIAQKIGEDAPLFAVFKARVATGEIWTPELEATEPGRDWILSRILWLDGLDAGKNQGGNVDSHDRYIYIHGTNEEDKIGTPVSHGCIRMRNADVVSLFDQVSVETRVNIRED
ncbi:MAG: L,D-transpeptidase family protein [Thiobacillus sp.]